MCLFIFTSNDWWPFRTCVSSFWSCAFFFALVFQHWRRKRGRSSWNIHHLDFWSRQTIRFRLMHFRKHQMRIEYITEMYKHPHVTATIKHIYSSHCEGKSECEIDFIRIGMRPFCNCLTKFVFSADRFGQFDANHGMPFHPIKFMWRESVEIFCPEFIYAWWQISNLINPTFSG